MQVTVGGEAVQHCTPSPSDTVDTSVLSREYDGMTVYSPPVYCSLVYPTLTVVHGDLHTASCTAEEASGDTGLSAAVVGAPATFRVVARDAFGNIRYIYIVHTQRSARYATSCRTPDKSICTCSYETYSGWTCQACRSVPKRCPYVLNFSSFRGGDSTTNLELNRDGSSDVFMVTLSGANGYRVVTSSAVQIVSIDNDANPAG